MRLLGRRSAVPAAAGYSVIDHRMTITGEIHTDGAIRVDGRVEGSLHHADMLIVGAEGAVVGDVEAREIVIGGAVHGNLTATGRVEVQKSATVRGDIRAAAVLLQEGATVHGHVSINPVGTDTAFVPERRILQLTPAHSSSAVSDN